MWVFNVFIYSVFKWRYKKSNKDLYFRFLNRFTNHKKKEKIKTRKKKKYIKWSSKYPHVHINIKVKIVNSLYSRVERQGGQLVRWPLVHTLRQWSDSVTSQSSDVCLFVFPEVVFISLDTTGDPSGDSTTKQSSENIMGRVRNSGGEKNMIKTEVSHNV